MRRAAIAGCDALSGRFSEFPRIVRRPSKRLISGRGHGASHWHSEATALSVNRTEVPVSLAPPRLALFRSSSRFAGALGGPDRGRPRRGCPLRQSAPLPCATPPATSASSTRTRCRPRGSRDRHHQRDERGDRAPGCNLARIPSSSASRFSIPPGPPAGLSGTRTTMDSPGGLVAIDTFQIPPGPPLRSARPSLAMISIHPPGPCRANHQRDHGGVHPDPPAGPTPGLRSRASRGAHPGQ